MSLTPYTFNGWPQSLSSNEKRDMSQQRVNDASSGGENSDIDKTRLILLKELRSWHGVRHIKPSIIGPNHIL